MEVRWIKTLIVIGLLNTTMYSQVGSDYTYRFLNLPSSPLQASLGGKNFTNQQQVNQAFLNPALINKEMDNQLAVNFSKVYGVANYGSAGYSKTFQSNKNIFIGANYINYGDLEGYDQFGNATGSFSGNEVALVVGSSYQLDQSNWYIGANVKFVFSNMESYNSIGTGLDLGVLYKDDITGWDIAFSTRNLGGQLKTYNGHREKMPIDVAIAISKQLENVPLRWHVTIDNLQQWDLSTANPNRGKTTIEGIVEEEKVGFFNNALRHVILGIELFPDKKISARLGYNFRKGEELKIVDHRHFAGFTAGIGFKTNRIRFDYSYGRQTVAANTSMFGVVINMN